jgi:hypothetical protein
MSKKFNFHADYNERVEKKKALDSISPEEQVRQLIKDEGYHTDYDAEEEGFEIFRDMSDEELDISAEFYTDSTEEEQMQAEEEYGKPNREINFLCINFNTKEYYSYMSWVDGSDQDDNEGPIKIVNQLVALGFIRSV